MNYVMQQLKTALLLLICMTVLTGLIYPACVTAIAQFFFPRQANGSIIQFKGKNIGSALIGQPFTKASYFWSRPSATTGFPYDPMHATGSNLSPTNPKFILLVQSRITLLEKLDPKNKVPTPIDLVTASGSGLDPDISVSAAIYQAHRIALQRHLTDDKVIELIHKHTTPRSLGIFGNPRVNVLELNLALDNL